MPIARFQMPDGRVARFEVPEGTTPEQANAMMQSHFSQPQEPTQAQPEQHQAPVSTNIGGGVAQGLVNIGSSALLNPLTNLVAGGASKIADLIGADKAAEALRMTAAQSGEQKRAEAENVARQAGLNTDSIAYKGGELIPELMATGGVAGALGKGAAKVGAAKLAQALRTGGFGEQLGKSAAENAALRVAGGAAGGAIAAGLTGDNIKGGAAIGAAIPVGGKVLATVLRETLGATTGAGGKTIQQAFQAGKQGGTAAESLAENMRGNVPMTDVLDQAKSALANMRAERGAFYRAGMGEIGAVQKPLDYQPIVKAAQDAMNIKRFKGESISSSTEGIQQKIAEQINKWGGLDPAEYHTAEGLDALKQSIGDLRDATQFGSPERKVADSVYHAIKAEIVKADPKYASVMKDYETASGLIGEIEDALSLKNKASADTAMRKLQSLTRNNVNTNYGNRAELADKLRQYGADNMMNALSGQALNSWTPRGLQGVSATGLGGIGVMTGNPAAIPLVAAASPRLAGEASLLAGKLAAKAPTNEQKAALVRALSTYSNQ